MDARRGVTVSAGAPGRTARRIALAAFLVYAVTGGGRVVGSDELAMLELDQALLHGGIAVPEGATMQGPDGRFYTKNAAGEAIAALPLVALSEAAASAAHLPPPRRTLAVRFGASFFNALVTAALLGAFYALARALDVTPGGALGATALLGFTTPVWVYAKSFMAEPLQALGLLLALGGAALGGRARRAGWLAGLGVLLAVSAKLSMLPLALVCLMPLVGAPAATWAGPALGLAVALAGHAAYDVARFGTPWETGYGAQASLSAYTTPMLVGLYGLLLSSGKGVAWFAPALWLAPAGFTARARGRRGTGAPRTRWRELGPAARACWTVGALWGLALLLYSRFQHWAGDGSFGPRYLVPVLAPGFLLVAFALQRAGRVRRALAWALGLAGLLVQLGGVAIYFGAQMRESGDYPYTLPLEDPHFMSDSHFNPRFTPIAGHWRMLARNAGEHLHGVMPHVSAGGGEGRLGISAMEQSELLHALDFWWLYTLYAGLPRAPVLGALALFVVLAAWAITAMRRAWRAEARAG
jgi:hypothetical protein